MNAILKQQKELQILIQVLIKKRVAALLIKVIRIKLNNLVPFQHLINNNSNRLYNNKDLMEKDQYI